MNFTYKRTLITTIAGMALVFAATPNTAAAAAATCYPTGFFRDINVEMTAAQIGGNVTGSLDAGGCTVGVYYDSAHTGNVTGATIFGATYFGVLVNGDVGSVTVNVTNSTIRDIGETPLNGSQHGNAIVYRAMDASDAAPSASGTASGLISGNTVSHYQKNGITVRGGVSATISNNVVTGEGPVDYIAQNGIQVSYGATAVVKGNTVSLNNYTPAAYVACGVLLYQAAGVKTSGNTLFDNERDLCNFGRGGGHFNAS